MKIKKLYTWLLIGTFAIFAACNNENEAIDPNVAIPSINLPIEQLEIDLNKVDNLPIVAIIKSEAGLKQVDMSIKTDKGVEHFKTVTDFFNAHSYSLDEEIEYRANMQTFIIKAIDKLNREVEGSIAFNVTDVMARPEILFESEEIVYDEMDEKPTIPTTTFNVVSEAGLKLVECFKVSSIGQTIIAQVNLNGETEYNFSENINYKEGDRGFKVKATDKYNNVTISTMPVTYRVVPIPVLLLGTEPIEADSDVKKGLPMKITSVRGVKELVIYRIEGSNEVEALRQTMNGEKELDIAPEIEFTPATSSIKVMVTDGREGKEVYATQRAYVDLQVVTATIGSQPFANTPNAKFPETYACFSLKDMKTYSVDYAIASEANASDIDFKFYCFGGSAVPRLYSMDNTEKDGEFAGSTGKLSAIPVKCGTRFALLGEFDFLNATTTSIAEKVLSSSINTSKLTPFEVGDVIAFRTSGKSSVGGGRIGVMKVVSMTAPKELVSANATARVMTLEIKLPKKK